MRLLHAAICASCVLFAGCAGSTPLAAAAGESRRHVLYVVRRAHHTGIAVRVDAWTERQWPVLGSFPHATVLEFGWGDAEYYQADEKTLGMTLRAALWPTSSVMEVLAPARLDSATSEEYSSIELRVSDAELRKVAAAIQHSFAGSTPQATGVAAATADGTSRFYRARGKFHFFRMCNYWTAQRLEDAGCTLGALPVISATRVLEEAQRCSAQR